MRLRLVFAMALAGCGGGAGAALPAVDASARDAWVFDLGTLPPEADAALPEADVAATDLPAAQDVPIVSDVAPPSEPVRAAPNQWTWVDVPASRCANGSPTGFGINRATSSDTVVIFLQGGGACWDGVTCLNPVPTSFYVTTGYNRLAFETDVARAAMLPMRRLDPTNPFRGMHLVYVPYCTGDVHAGDRVSRYTFLGRTAEMHHVGYRNIGHFLPRITATFPDARRVIVMGDSAGGFGAALHMDHVQRAFPRARVDVLDDSGPPVQPDPARWRAWREAWGMRFPEGCADCETGIAAVVRFLQSRYPDHRFGLISYTHDGIISTFMGMTAFQFWDALRGATASLGSAWPGARYFLLPGALHVGMLTPTPAMIRWMDAFAREDPRWASEGP